MNKKYQELLAEFNKGKNDLEAKEQLYKTMNSRSFKAKQTITQLEQEKISLKGQRPDLLADGKSVDKLNKRLKEVDEEIELKEDEIIGLNKKIPDLRKELYTLCQNTNSIYSQLVNLNLPELYPAYNEMAQQLAEKVKEFWVLKNMGQDCYATSYWVSLQEKASGALDLIPSLPKERAPIFNRSNYDSSGIEEKLRKRFGIPEYDYRNYNEYK